MRIHPMTAEEALDYAPKAALLDFDGPVTPDLIMALKDHLSYAISALATVSAKLFEAEDTIVDLHSSNLELADLLRAQLTGVRRPIDGKTRPHTKLIEDHRSDGGIDPAYGRQLNFDDFDDVPSREPIEIVDEDDDLGYDPHYAYDGHFGIQPWPTTVEFHTDPGTYDANRGEIHRLLAEEIVAQYGQNPTTESSEIES